MLPQSHLFSNKRTCFYFCNAAIYDALINNAVILRCINKQDVTLLTIYSDAEWNVCEISSCYCSHYSRYKQESNGGMSQETLRICLASCGSWSQSPLPSERGRVESGQVANHKAHTGTNNHLHSHSPQGHFSVAS